MTREGETIQLIRDRVRTRALSETFAPADVNRALRINWAGSFLPNHRVGNPGGGTELFVKVERGRYRLK